MLKIAGAPTIIIHTKNTAIAMGIKGTLHK
jgi:hypothetical protein